MRGGEVFCFLFSVLAPPSNLTSATRADTISQQTKTQNPKHARHEFSSTRNETKGTSSLIPSMFDHPINILFNGLCPTISFFIRIVISMLIFYICFLICSFVRLVSIYWSIVYSTEYCLHVCMFSILNKAMKWENPFTLI